MHPSCIPAAPTSPHHRAGVKCRVVQALRGSRLSNSWQQGTIQTPPPPRDSHDARTHNSDNTTVPTATRQDFSSFLSRTIFRCPNFSCAKKKVSKKSRPVTPGLAPFDKRLDQHQKRKSVDLCPLPLNPQRPRCHLVSTFHVTLWDKHRSRQTFSSSLLFSSGLPVAVLTGT